MKLTEERCKVYSIYEASKPLHLENGITSKSERKEGIMNITLLAYIRNWLETTKKLEVKAATYDRLNISIAALEKYPIADIPLTELTTEDFREYVNALVEDGYSLTTVKKQMRIVSAPVRYAYEQRQIPFNPCAAVKVPSKVHIKKEAKQIVAYTTEEQNRIKPHLAKHGRIGFYAIELMLETGMRAGEVLALNWSDVYLDRKRIRVHKTMVNLANRRISYIQEGAKSETSNRWVPLSPRAIEILTELRSKTNEEYLFQNAYGERLSYEGLRYQCQCACQETGIPYLGLHVWRHTFATNQYYKGTDVKILSKILGHADTSITYNIYIHLYGDGFDEMLSAVC